MAASTQILTDIASAISTGPSDASKTNAVNPAKPMQDIDGMLKLAQLKLKEAKIILSTLSVSVLDSGDGIKTTLDDILLSLD